MDHGQIKRKYTREFKESAVRLVNVERTPVAKAAADLGMPVNTLVAWLHRARRGKGSFTPPGGVDWERRPANRRRRTGGSSPSGTSSKKRRLSS